MAEQDKRFYWLRLKRDFFKRHDITIVETLPNGKDYILFYLKLLCESVDHEGNLRFSDTIPYDERMLSALTNTNIDIVRSAMNIFSELKMIDILDDRTIYMREIDKMIGSETYWAERKRLQRTPEIVKCPTNVQLLSNDSPTCPSKSIEYRDKIIDNKEKEIIKKDCATSRFKKPTINDVKDYCLERNNNVDAQKFIDYYESIGWFVGKKPMKDWKACVRTWEHNSTKSNTKTFSNSIDNQVGKLRDL